MGFLSRIAELAEMPAGTLEVKAAFDRLCPACQRAAIKAALAMGKTRVAKCERGEHDRA